MIDQFTNMPKGMQILVAVAGGGGLLAVATMFDARIGLIVAIFLIVITVAIFVWQFFTKWRAKRRGKNLSHELASNTAPASVSEGANRAKLDSLRTTFNEGLQRYAAAGKDLYSLPWYVVCGEPGSGKTEAVRHCNVGFPPGMQNEMQGTGGTINMQWWFTNHAVLIDTAGKLLFQEAPPGSTTEWSEFLKLLRKTRPNCPINGLLLVIPSESLVRDKPAEIERKAGKIAQQLDTIQRTLDVRFPVYVLITKCDLINGFREFFSGIKDPQLQHQMTGWSNPEPLDTPFRPEAVDQHLGEVVHRMRRRRLGMLRDPIPVEPPHRRIDEVDALCALPAAIGALAPRLNKYLSTIFVAGAWSAKPLFLRGIYFTSALTEGAALDEELSKVLGVPAEQLKQSKAWERERSYFLRDLFIEKIFKENGLVTRAGNTTQLLRRRRRILSGVVVSGLAVLVIISFFGYKALKSSVGGELVYWRAGVAEENWSGNRWRPIVNNKLEFTGNEMIRLDDGREWPVVEYHEQLRRLVTNDLRIPWIFKPVESLAVRANPGRRQAQRTLFEASVITPVIEATASRLVNATSWTPADSERLAALIELEGSIHLRDLPGFNPEYPAEDFFAPLLAPSMTGVKDGTAILNRLMQTFEWTYPPRDIERGMWPPPRYSNGKTLRSNQPLNRGWNALDQSIQAAQSSQGGALQAIQSGRLLVVGFADAEKAFLAAIAQPRSNANWGTNVRNAWNELTVRRLTMDRLVEDLKQKTGLTTEVTLDASYRATVGRIREEANRTSQRIRSVLARQKPAADAASRATSGPASEFTLYRDLERRLSSLQTQITAQFEQLLSASEQTQIVELDAQILRVVSGGAPAYAARCDAYAEAVELLAPVAPKDRLLGRLAEITAQHADAMAKLRDRVAKYDGSMRGEFNGGIATLLDNAAQSGVQAIVDSYRQEFDRAFPETLGYPLGTGPSLTPEKVKSMAAELARVGQDATAPALVGDVRRSLESRLERAQRLAAFAAPLLAADGSPTTVKLVLLRDRDQAPTVERVLGAPSGQRLPSARVYPSIRVAGRSFRARGLPENTQLDKFSISAPLSPIEFFNTPDPKAEADAKIATGSAWGALRLLQAGAVRQADGKEWETVLRLNDRGTELVLAVQVTFNQPLPALDRWPSAPQK
ncbi:MAG TPA: type VI secretion protein IcmF/TssM N-terminal domain-containing protein [Lacunisphaera sp.]|nr:type VI secretion protein IcmF/TssM N-terminal domain-containing protein [Lacunisphaera sp.]